MYIAAYHNMVHHNVQDTLTVTMRLVSLRVNDEAYLKLVFNLLTSQSCLADNVCFYAGQSGHLHTDKGS